MTRSKSEIAQDVIEAINRVNDAGGISRRDAPEIEGPFRLIAEGYQQPGFIEELFRQARAGRGVLSLKFIHKVIH